MIGYADGKTVSYFRGRKLYGKSLKLPKGFKGIVVSSTDRILPKETSLEEEEDEDMQSEEVKVLEEQATFDEVMVWGHEVVVEEADPYVRGVEEWIGFAGQVCDASVLFCGGYCVADFRGVVDS